MYSILCFVSKFSLAYLGLSEVGKLPQLFFQPFLRRSLRIKAVPKTSPTYKACILADSVFMRTKPMFVPFKPEFKWYQKKTTHPNPKKTSQSCPSRASENP